MNSPARFNPHTRTEPLYLFPPSIRADTFRDLEDIAHNMQPAHTTDPRTGNEVMMVNEWMSCFLVGDVGRNEPLNSHR
jgi:hypothetical protein